MVDDVRFIDRWTIEFKRFYAHPVERVWRAITDPKEFGRWFIRGSLEPWVGGAYQFQADDWRGVVLAFEPPRFIKFSNGHGDDVGYFQYELSEADGGTQMRFVQHFDPAGAYAADPDDLGGDLPVPGTPWKPGFVGGWYEFWESLRDHIDGVALGSRLPRTEFQALAESMAKDILNAGQLDEKGAARLALQFRRKERWNELNKIYRTFIRDNCPPK